MSSEQNYSSSDKKGKAGHATALKHSLADLHAENVSGMARITLTLCIVARKLEKAHG